MATHEAGVQVVCPGCGQTVLQKAMIPILGDNGQGIRYLCAACARSLIAPGPAAANGSDAVAPAGEAPGPRPGAATPSEGVV